MVTRMSLVEKVNVTTGTGWMGDLCVGNTGSTSVGFPALCLQGEKRAVYTWEGHASRWILDVHQGVEVTPMPDVLQASERD